MPPVTAPKELTVAIDVLLLLHAPPLTVLPKVIVALEHTEAAPLIVPATGVEFTVTDLVVQLVPQLLFTR
jgi:hypothetical protein